MNKSAAFKICRHSEIKVGDRVRLHSFIAPDDILDCQKFLSTYDGDTIYTVAAVEGDQIRFNEAGAQPRRELFPVWLFKKQR